MFPLKDNIPTDRAPIVTIGLIVANVLVYFLLQEGGWQITSLREGEWSLREFAAFPCDLTDRCEPPPGHVDEVVSVFTSMFMHGGVFHLAGNMLFLWIFGNNVEDSMGRLKFLGFYLAGGIAAIAAQTAIEPGADVPTVGASGAVSAVLGGYLLLYPRARVITVVFLVIFFTLIELPAMLVLVLWFAMQVFFASTELVAGGQEGGGVAYFAHIGGFVFGMLVIRLLARPKREAPARYRM